MRAEQDIRPELLNHLFLLVAQLKDLDAPGVAQSASLIASAVHDGGTATIMGRDAPRATTSIAQLASRLYRIRRLREQMFGPHFAQDAVWDMLLDLFAAEGQAKRITVSSLCIAAAVPQTSGLRMITYLVKAGLVTRAPDQRDRRRVFVDLTEKARTSMAAFHAAVTGTMPGHAGAPPSAWHPLPESAAPSRALFAAAN